MTIKHVLSTGKSSASPRGLHAAFALSTCARKHELSMASCDDEQPAWAVVGKTWHDLLAAYFTSDRSEAIHVSDEGMPRGEGIAYSMMHSFAARYKRTIFGSVIGAEIPVEGTIDTVALTGRIDLITRLSARQRKALFAEWQIDLTEDGYYIIDHKSGSGRLSPSKYDAYRWHPQTYIYKLLYEQQFPRRKIVGRFIHYQDKTAQHRSWLIKQQDPSRKYIMALMSQIDKVRSNTGKNPMECFSGGYLCEYYAQCWARGREK